MSRYNSFSHKHISIEFREYVSKVIQNVSAGDECKERLWGKTPLDQHFAIATTNTLLCHVVYVIIDEEYRDLKVVREQHVNDDYVLQSSYHLTLEGALQFRNETHQKLSNGIFPEDIAYRVRKVPIDCINNPDYYLKPGDHIQRDLDATISFASHEGIYLGNGEVAHISVEDATINGFTALYEKAQAFARIHKIKEFAHCIRRRSREDICKTATRLVKERHKENEYHLFLQNCQHFAGYCAVGKEWMSEKDHLVEKGTKYGALAAVGIAGIIGAVALFGGDEEKEKKEKQLASTSRR